MEKTAVGKGWHLTALRLKSRRIFFLAGSTERGRIARNSSKVKVTFPTSRACSMRAAICMQYVAEEKVTPRGLQRKQQQDLHGEARLQSEQVDE